VGIPEQALSFVLPGIVGGQVLTLRHQMIVDDYEARRNSFMPAQPLVTFVSPGRALAGGARIWTGLRTLGQMRNGNRPSPV